MKNYPITKVSKFIVCVLALTMLLGFTSYAQKEERPVLDPATEEQLRVDYLVAFKSANPNDSAIQNLTVDDFMSVDELQDTTDEKEIKIGQYIFTFGAGSSVPRFLVYKGSEFIPVKDAFDSGMITTEDVQKIGEIRGGVTYWSDYRL